MAAGGCRSVCRAHKAAAEAKAARAAVERRDGCLQAEATLAAWAQQLKGTARQAFQCKNTFTYIRRASHTQGSAGPVPLTGHHPKNESRQVL